jgi:hypothetical protein
MDYKKAFEELDVDINTINYVDIDITYLNKIYRKQALKFHPDKNGNTIESTMKFQKINEAYEYLKREITELNPSYHINIEETTETDSSLYLDILQMFLKSIFSDKYSEPFFNTVKDIIKDIVMNIKKTISVHIFDQLDKDTSFTIYNFLSKYRNVFHLNQDILDQVREKVLGKYENVMIYKLNPSIDDLLNNNMFKLFIDEQLYLVPLWYNESHFYHNEDSKDSKDSLKNDKKEIIVLCDPELPDNVSIDEENDLHVEFHIEFNEIQKLFMKEIEPKINVNIGKKVFEILLEKIYIKKTQVYRIKNMGLTKINDFDMYDVSERSDIIVKICIV